MFLRANWTVVSAVSGLIFWAGGFVTASSVNTKVAILDSRIANMTAIMEKLVTVVERHDRELSGQGVWIDQHEKIHSLREHGAVTGRIKK
jgi:hypothetical protein